MKKIFLVIIFSLVVVTFQMNYFSAEVTDVPQWVVEVRLDAIRAFHTTVAISFVNISDHVDRKEYNAFRLQGEGSLKKIPDPFGTMRALFPAENGWEEDLQYAADGHGSSSFALRKETFICIASVWIDSSCDDDKTDHIPSVFRFSIDCRK